MSTEFWVQVAIQAIALGVFGGTILTKINYLEKKQDKHNSLIERMVKVESKCDALHDRMDKLED